MVIRRISYIAGPSPTRCWPGLGLVQYLRVVHGMTWLSPLAGAAAAALVSALVIGWVSLRLRQREDTVIGAVWAVGMAAGIVLISLTPGYAADLMSYLFGNILMLTPRDLLPDRGAGVAVLVGRALPQATAAVCFDDEFASLRGVRTARYHFLLLGLTALTVVVVSVVGIIMVIALLTLPAATANHLTRRLSHDDRRGALLRRD
ncbi:MAG: metal ABC transporter permease [bacterium]|nr:metal ABC transporter permease [bacterium]